MIGAEGENPFPGLRPFTSLEAAVFFGRDEQIDKLLSLLEGDRLVAVVGRSGSGKSSLVHAGLIPALHGASLPQLGGRWSVASLRPGSAPIARLAAAVSPALDPSGAGPSATASLEAELRRSSLGLIDAARSAPSGYRLLIVIDQFEELFRYQGSTFDERARFVELLLEAAKSSAPVHILLTMRSDYLGSTADFAGLSEAVNDGLFLVPQLTRSQLSHVVTAPVAVAGAEISSRLTQRVLNDGAGDPDVLPLLQHALMRTWDVWSHDDERGVLDLRHYEQTGGVQGALSTHAEEVFASHSEPEHVEIAFRRLTARDDRGGEVRTPADLAALGVLTGREPHRARELLEPFGDERSSFLVISDDGTVDLTHESLIRQWDRLRAWTEDEAADASRFRRLLEAGQLFGEGQRELLRGAELTSAADWWDRRAPTAEWADRYGNQFTVAEDFLRVSRESARRWRNAKIFGVAGLAVVALALLGLSVALSSALEETESARDEAEEASAVALASAARQEQLRSELEAQRDEELEGLGFDVLVAGGEREVELSGDPEILAIDIGKRSPSMVMRGEGDGRLDVQIASEVVDFVAPGRGGSVDAASWRSGVGATEFHIDESTVVYARIDGMGSWTISVTLEEEPIPDVVGLDERDATERIQEAGFEPSIAFVSTTEDMNDLGVVRAQVPSPEVSAERFAPLGTVVRMLVERDHCSPAEAERVDVAFSTDVARRLAEGGSTGDLNADTGADELFVYRSETEERPVVCTVLSNGTVSETPLGGSGRNSARPLGIGSIGGVPVAFVASLTSRDQAEVQLFTVVDAELVPLTRDDGSPQIFFVGTIRAGTESFSLRCVGTGEQQRLRHRRAVLDDEGQLVLRDVHYRPDPERPGVLVVDQRSSTAATLSESEEAKLADFRDCAGADFLFHEPIRPPETTSTTTGTTRPPTSSGTSTPTSPPTSTAPSTSQGPPTSSGTPSTSTSSASSTSPTTDPASGVSTTSP
ncbi:MAG: AAA family ATPase [Actinomycetota bacterium]